MARATDAKAKTSVKMGNFHDRYSSSLKPAKVPKTIIAIIWKAIFEYFA